MSRSFAAATQKLFAQLHQQKRQRSLHASSNQQGFIDLSHNDYLNLHNDQVFNKNIKEAIDVLPVGAGASRLLGGEHAVFSELENKFCNLEKNSSSFVF